jgi:hypothetical protein
VSATVTELPTMPSVETVPAGHYFSRSVVVQRGDWNDCEHCGRRRLGRGPHGATWRPVGTLMRLVDCAGRVVDRREVEGKPYEDEGIS